MDNLSEGILYRKKDSSQIFNFQLLMGSLRDQQLLNNYTGDPTLPIIGKYSRNQYHFLHVDMVVAMPLSMKDGKNFTYQDNKYSQVIKIPIEVTEVVKNIPQQIPTNKKPKQKSLIKGSKKTPKQTLHQYIQPDSLDESHENDDKIPLYHPIQFNYANKAKFVWSIQSVKDNKIFQPLQTDPCLSYILHNMIFEELDFSYQKRLVHMQPLTILRPYNIYEWLKDSYKSVCFGQLRTEQISTHLSGGALCFSPNNMKIGLDMTKKIASFWSVILQENNEHIICLHWIIMDLEYAQKIQTITKSAQNIYSILSSFENFGENVLVKEVQGIFT